MLRIAIVLAASVALMATPALAKSLSRTIPANKTSVLMPIIGVDMTNCTIYQARDAKITTQPSNGMAAIVEKTLPLPPDYAQCKGKVVKVKLLAYQPKGRFVGLDHVGVSYTMPSNTGENSQVYNAFDIEVTVK